MFNLLIAKPSVGNYHYIEHAGKERTLCGRKPTSKWFIRSLQSGEVIPPDRICRICLELSPNFIITSKRCHD